MDNKKSNFLRDLIICVALFLIMFSIRTLMAPNFSNTGNPDAAWAAMQTEYLIKHGFQYPYNDTKTLYPIGREYYPNQIGWWIVGAVGYKIAAFITGTTGFDQQLLTTVMMWAIAIVSSLAAPFVYLFIRELFGIEAGILTALFLCFYLPTFYYTTYGNPENDGFGFALFFAGLWIFVRYLRTGKILDLILFTIINLWSSLTWQSYGVLSVIIGLSAIIYTLSQLFLKYYKKKEISIEKIKRYNWMIVSLLAINLFGVLIHSGFTVGNTVLIFALVLNTFVLIKEKKLEIQNNKSIIIAPIILVLLIVFGGISQLFTTLDFAGIHLFKSNNVNPEVQKYTKIVYETIAEQQPIKKSAASYFGKPFDQVGFLDVIQYLSDTQFGWALWITLFIILILFGLFAYDLIINGRVNEIYLALSIVFSYAIVSLVKKPVSLFFLSALCVISVGILIGLIIKLLRSINKLFSMSASILAFILILSLVPNTTIYAENFYNGLSWKWENTLNWLKNNTEYGSIITSWWDYGHYYGYYLDGHNRYTIDNIQYGPFIYDVAKAFTNTICNVPNQREIDLELNKYYPFSIISTKTAKTIMNTSCIFSLNELPKKLLENEKESLKILEKYKTDYILIDDEVILGKLNALEHIAGNGNGGFFTSKLIRTNKGFIFNFGGMQIPIDYNNYFKAQVWPGAIVNIPGTNNKIRILIKGDTVYIPYYYKVEYVDNNKWKLMAYPDPNSPVLFQFMTRIFFHDPSLKYVKPVFDNGKIVIYKVDWKKYFEDNGEKQ